MALGNTQSITYNGVAKTLSLINQDGYSSEYFLKETTQEFSLKIRHTREKALLNGVQMDRHNVELTRTIYPAVAGSPQKTEVTYVVMRFPRDGDATAEAYLQTALNGFLSAATSVKIIGWES
ncbi:MAG: putative coat protein [Leviviridae sp.]|nr:MAG: putative coat protein [Leviviridae sp.]